LHKKVLAVYKKHSAEALLPGLTSASEENQRIFYEKSKTSGAPIHREIQAIYRTKIKGKEYFWYHQELRSEDSLQNEIEVFMPHIGKYETPFFSFVTDPNTGAKIPTDIKRTEDVYELQWPKDWTSELEEDLTDKLNLVLIANGRHYGGYTWDDFKNRTFEELLTFGKYGVFSKPVNEIIKIEDDRRKEADKEKRHR
jgi:hypothetical protein